MKNYTYKCEISSLESGELYTMNLSCFSPKEVFDYLTSLEENGKVKVLSVENSDGRLIKWSGISLRRLLAT